VDSRSYRCSIICSVILSWRWHLIMANNVESNANNKKLAIKLVLIVVAGLAFGFALAPLYDVVCKTIGLNGRGDTTATVASTKQEVDMSRIVEVIFTGNTMPGLDWEFSSNEATMQLHPGEIKLTSFTAKNVGKKAVTGVAVPSVAPEVASLYFKKIACFCFNEQTLAAGESKEMPVRFFVSPDLPKDITTVTLSYAFYNANDRVNAAAVE
jgi:cytochrome c oxidase assembly protein subunit 11